MYDIVIENGTIIFGDLTLSKKLNIGIMGDKIAKITKDVLCGKKVINAKGKIITPGFIDVNSHSDMLFLNSKQGNSKLYQGVTTEVNGGCGLGFFPKTVEYEKEVDSYVENHFLNIKKPFNNIKSIKDIRELKFKNPIINQAYLVSASCLRISTMGFSRKDAEKNHLKEMIKLLESELKNGALGISFSLLYQPGSFMKKNEIIALLKVIAKYNKIATFHLRNEGVKIIDGILEVINYAKRSKAKIHISHLKIMDPRYWGKSLDVINLLKKEREKGVEITFDQYPYLATNTNLMVLVPTDYYSGDMNQFLENLDYIDEDFNKKLYQNIKNRGGESRIVITNNFVVDKKFVGKSLKDISLELEKDVVSTVIYLIKKYKGKVLANYFIIDEGDMFNFLKDDLGVISSDGISLQCKSKSNNLHPKNFNTFPKFLKICRDKKILTTEEAIYKITGKPASIFSIKDRGIIKVGNFADMLIISLKGLKETGTYEKPFLKCEGIETVIINGEIAVEKDIEKKIYFGKIL